MTRAMTVLTLIALLAGSASAVFDAHFWGSPIATLSKDTLGIPEADILPEAHGGTYYAQIPLSIIQGWMSSPETNYGLAIIPRETAPGSYPNNTCFTTYLTTWRWEMRPRLRMTTWASYAQEQAAIRENQPEYSWTPTFPAADQAANGGQYCGANHRNVLLLKWTDLMTGPGGSDLGDYRTLSWGATWDGDPGAPFTYDVYVAPAYWDEWDITYAGYVTPGNGDIYLPGDANQDGVVNTDDLGILLANWGQSGGWTQGDFNDDGVVNTDDLGLLLGNWGQSSTVVPEPATLALLGVGGLGLIRRRR